jgi:hypothetical protein
MIVSVNVVQPHCRKATRPTLSHLFAKPTRQMQVGNIHTTAFEGQHSGKTRKLPFLTPYRLPSSGRPFISLVGLGIQRLAQPPIGHCAVCRRHAGFDRQR